MIPLLIISCLMMAAIVVIALSTKSDPEKTQTIRFNTPGKRTKKLVPAKVDIDVGVADILITFCDGRVFTSKIYGSFYSSVDEGNDEWIGGRREWVREPKVDNGVHSAQQKAHEEIGRRRVDEYHSFTNTSEAPTKSMHGQVSTIEIMSVSPYIVTFDSFKVVDV